ncbi:MAG: hypothetical protein GYB65_02715 [Chloroflexi bacterium]|nr:hypothetical protein [Chloroflexota bacterium]
MAIKKYSAETPPPDHYRRSRQDDADLPPSLYADEQRSRRTKSRRTTEPPDELPPPRDGYRELQQQARYDSMAWWRYKIAQGLRLGGSIVAVGLIVLLLQAMTGSPRAMAWLGGLVVVAGLGMIGRYALAPLTCKWLVIVPENWTYVIEDDEGYTREYLPSGRLLVPWRWHVFVREYVDFSTVTVTEVIRDALNSQVVPVDIEASVSMVFDPTQADPAQYATLRKMDSPDIFERMLARDLRDIIHRYLKRLSPEEAYHLQHDADSLEELILDELAGRAPLGLFPAPKRPVMVHIRVPQQVRDAYQSLWRRKAQMRDSSESIREIKALAQELGLPFDEAFQLFYIMDRGQAPGPSTRRPPYNTEAGSPPVVVIQQPSGQPPASAPPVIEPGISETVEHDPVSPPPRIVEDPDQAPDPFDLRRKRKNRHRDQDQG